MSQDWSRMIAKKYGCEIETREPVPVVELLHMDVARQTRHPWIVFLDPDEVMPLNVADILRRIITENSSVGMIRMPWRFYFKGKPIRGTIWGGEKYKAVVFHRDRNRFLPDVHHGSELLPGFSEFAVPWSEDLAIKHFWVDSLHEMISKHFRYIKQEGPSRFRREQRFSLLALLIDSFKALKDNLFLHEGKKAGLLGIGLSAFYAAYVVSSHLSLGWFQYGRKGRIDK